MSTKAIELCNIAELKEGSSRGFDPLSKGYDTVFVVRQKGGQLYAYKNDCPHHPGSPLAWKKDAYLSFDGKRIACHGHGAQFEIESGLCLSGPCLGESLQRLSIKQEDNGDLILFL